MSGRLSVAALGACVLAIWGCKGGAGSDGPCVETGGGCATDEDCCNWHLDEGFCVEGVCADECSEAKDCASLCCATLASGQSVCGPDLWCIECVPVDSSCSSNNDCCNWHRDEGYCVEGTCLDACSSASDCASGCCVPLEGGGSVCAAATYCS